MKKLSRMESNKEARRSLNRHGVDLAYCQYSCSGHELRLTGWLCKHDSSDFNPAQIEALIHDIQRCIPGISIAGDFENWKFSSDHISFVGDKKDSSRGSYSNEEGQERYEIDLDDL
jgi:hypothetical protein